MSPLLLSKLIIGRAPRLCLRLIDIGDVIGRFLPTFGGIYGMRKGENQAALMLGVWTAAPFILLFGLFNAPGVGPEVGVPFMIGTCLGVFVAVLMNRRAMARLSSDNASVTETHAEPKPPS